MHEYKAALSGMHWPSGRCLFVTKVYQNPLYPLEMINIEIPPQVFGLLKKNVFTITTLRSQFDLTVSL